MANDYTAIDAAILKRIGDGARQFLHIDAGSVAVAAKAIADAENKSRDRWRAMDPSRIVDRRLQALRRAGKLKFERGPAAGWTICREGAKP